MNVPVASGSYSQAEEKITRHFTMAGLPDDEGPFHLLQTGPTCTIRYISATKAYRQLTVMVDLKQNNHLQAEVSLRFCQLFETLSETLKGEGSRR